MKKCPNCNTIMNEVLKIDVIIDVCPACMGIWLDKGELEKIIERATIAENCQNEKKYDKQESRNNDINDEYHSFDDDKHGKNRNGYPHKKRGGISEIFGNLFD
jgi:uncharacterized protein